MNPLTRELGCKHCKDVVPHQVYFIRRYETFKNVPGGDVIKQTRVVYEQYCCTCKSFEKHDVENKQWISLLKNRTWNARS